MSRSTLRSSLALVAFASLVTACSSSPKGGGGSTPDGGGGGAAESPNQATQHGTIVDYDSKKPVKGATVTAADQSVTTDEKGQYAFTLTKGEPFTMTVTASDYAKVIEQETTLDADFDRGPTNLPSTSTANLLLSALDGYDATLGVVTVQVIATGACASEAGAKVQVVPDKGAKVKYVLHGLPTAKLDSVAAGESLASAILYNVQPNVPVQVKVEHPTCKQSGFPVKKDGVVYTGNAIAGAGEVTSFVRVFLE